MNQNPLLVPMDQLLDYAAIQPEHVEPAIDRLLRDTRAAVDRATRPDAHVTWEDFVEPLLDESERLWRAWSAVGHLNAVVNTPELREAYNACLPKVTELSTWMGLHTGLYAGYRRLAEGPDFTGLSPVRQRIVELALRDFRLSGVELQGEQRERFARLSEEAAQASQKFSENVLDSVDRWGLHITDGHRLAGLPADALEAARQAARDEGLEGWKLSLKMPSYLPVMQHARDRDLRATLYRAYATIASEQGDPDLDNTALIEQLLALRAEEAALLGEASFAALRLQTRMARSAEEVLEFLRTLARKARPHAERDLAELREFARRELGLEALEPWDVAYASERLREQRYAYSEEEVKQFFPEPAVLGGMFALIEQLFGVRFTEMRAGTWHPQVRTFQVEGNEGIFGTLYLDLYARQAKQGGAWVDSERERRRTAAGVRLPVTFLTCNFTPPQGDRPSLLTHDEILTLFHEMGHALHALLSRVDDPGASAFASVEWDAIELPSQFMENFCWEWPVLRMLSGRLADGMPLPRELYDRLLAARNFQSGMQMVRQIEFALFDMLIHAQGRGLSIGAVMDTLGEVRREVAVLFPPAWHRFPHNFSHLFAGGYAAGYYSYKWAEVLSADAYALFEEHADRHADGSRDTLHAGIGARFRDEILAVGGSRPAADSFQAFRQRPPSMDALLRHSGISESTP